MLPPLVKSAIKADLEYAKKLHEATTGLPARMDTFHSQYGLNGSNLVQNLISVTNIEQSTQV